MIWRAAITASMPRPYLKTRAPYRSLSIRTSHIILLLAPFHTLPLVINIDGALWAIISDTARSRAASASRMRDLWFSAAFSISQYAVHGMEFRAIIRCAAYVEGHNYRTAIWRSIHHLPKVEDDDTAYHIGNFAHAIRHYDEIFGATA